MKFLKIFIAFLSAVLFLISFARAWEIKKTIIYPYKTYLLINIFYKEFPLQKLILALKEQKYPIFINYDFEIYKRRFFILKDVLLYKELYSQKLFYDPEKNLYFLEDNSNLISFDKAEKAVLKTVKLESYPLKFKLPPENNSLYLKVKVDINYKTHLSNDLRYTKKIHTKVLKISKTFELDEILAKP
ncbi:hypothetical protein [Thermodesulfobacterium hydrogeniphilum]|uniref:hypothetical protein n=1 Tax=Thermodesulfobacterium hydrogeniphilum TaxID=161156 RepID=UPI000A99A5A8|nr:hypothetical protein [Thermodesulfobacterium hydrogeniphilum]